MLLPVVTALTVAFAVQLSEGEPVPAEVHSSQAASRETVQADASAATDCPALFGNALNLDDRRASREARLEDVSRSEVLLDVVHSDPSWQTPKPMRVSGVEVRAVEAGPDGEPAARVHLSEAWSDTCPSGDYLVKADDGLGSDGLVLAVIDEGVLAEHKGELIFLPMSGRHPPQFRMIWQSPFGLSITPGSNASIAGAGSGVSPKRNSTRAASAKNDRSKKQRAKADAKAAAANRRNMARPVRPRG